MFDEKWFRFLVWSVSSFFFFISACVIMGTLGPPPSEAQIHQWMSGMMQAMENSLMAYSMGMEKDTRLGALMLHTTQLIVPMAIGGTIFGIFVRSQIKNNDKRTK